MNIFRKMSSILYMAGITNALIYSLDPTASNFGFSSIYLLKFLPYILVFLSMTILLVTSKFIASREFISITLFFSLMIFGSLYSMAVLGHVVEETYLSRSLGVVVFFSSYILSQDEKILKEVIKYIFPLIIFFSILVSLIVILFRAGLIYEDLNQVFQSHSILLAYSSIISYSYVKNVYIKYFLIIVLLISLILISKTTALALFVLTSIYLVYQKIGKYFKRKDRDNSYGVLIYTIIVIFVLVVSIYLLNSLYIDRIQERSNEVREYFAFIRISEFLASPWFGSLYTKTPLLDFGPLHIPSHSEWLDMLASAGMISIGIFMLPYVALIIKSGCLSFNNTKISLKNIFGFSLIAFALVMSVNPILFQPNISTLFWGSVGLLAGLVGAKKDYVF